MSAKLRLLVLVMAVAAIATAVLAIQRPWDGSSASGGGAALPTATAPAGPGGSGTPSSSAAGGETRSQPTRAPRPDGAEDAPDLERIHAWLNSEPLTLASLRGKVVLVDFWTYTCVNCVRTLPYLKQWDASYRDQGLVIIGVHSPEFQFEKELANVRRAVEGFNLKYAVALDNDFATWQNFRNRYWPAKYLIDKDGYIRYRHFGEGAYAETEEQIQELLREAGSGVALGSQIPRTAGEYDSSVLRDVTIELYLGHGRGSFYTYLGNAEGYKTDMPYSYQDYGLHFRNQFYLQGLWSIAEDGAEHARATPAYEDYIALKYTARSVNLVLKSLTGESLRSLVTLDGAPMEAAAKGDDVVIEADGNSYLVVREPRLYNLVKDQQLASRELKIYADSPAFAAFAFTFGP